MDKRIFKEILKIDEIERMQRRVETAELNLSIQKDIETDRKKKHELEIHWVLNGGGAYPQ